MFKKLYAFAKLYATAKHLMFILHSEIHPVSAAELCILTFGIVPRKLAYFENEWAD